MRVFSTATGELMRTIKVKGTGVRNNFVLSPDGSLIAADSTTEAWYPPFVEPGLEVEAGFVLLRAATGRIVFREKHRMTGEASESLPLFFSPGGETLIVDFNDFGKGDTAGHIIAYSLSGLGR